MKRTFFYTLIAFISITTACNTASKESNTADLQITDKENTASFKVDGVTITGDVSTQNFGSNKETDNFSVLCQQDEPLTLLQAVFANEKDTKTSKLTPQGTSYNVEVGQFGLSLSVPNSDKHFIANDKSGGSLKIEDNEMIITDMKLFDADGTVKTVSANIKF